MENKRFYLRENIIENMPKIIEAFVSFYGEDKREQIEDRFKNSIIAPHYSLEAYKNILDNEKEKIINRLIEDFKKETNITDEKNDSCRHRDDGYGYYRYGTKQQFQLLG